VKPQDVSMFLKQFEMTRGVMKSFSGSGGLGKMRAMRQMMTGSGSGIGTPGGPRLRTKGSSFMEKKDRNKKKRR
jgi:signal recognition particle GTPase